MPNTPAKYRESLVSFIDLLGFRQFVETAGTDAQRVLDVLSIVRQTGPDSAPSSHPSDASSIIFSDSLIRCRPLDAFDDVLDAIFVELDIISKIVRDFIWRGLFPRGGVTIGPVFMDSSQGIVFGPGYLRAYDLESKWAVYPRIIVDDSIKSKIDGAVANTDHTADDIEQLRNSLTLDDTRTFYLDYLRTLDHDDATDDVRFLRHHQMLIAERLETHKSNPSVWRKYAWLGEYHNRFINARLREYLPDVEKLEEYLVP